MSGGGTRCVSQLAVVKCMQQWGLHPTHYAGSSGGALVAALLASGSSPEDVLQKVKELSLLKLLKLKVNMRGLIDIGGTLKTFTSSLPERFEDLAVPVSMSATNLRTGNCEMFYSGELLPPLLASCCMPVFFSPILVGNDHYIDGGITNNFPADALVGKCRYILGVHTNPVDQNFNAESVKTILERTFLLAINGNVKNHKPLCHKVLEPDLLKKIKVFDLKCTEEVYYKTIEWLEPQMPSLAAEIQQANL